MCAKNALEAPLATLLTVVVDGGEPFGPLNPALSLNHLFPFQWQMLCLFYAFFPHVPAVTISALAETLPSFAHPSFHEYFHTRYFIA